MDNLSDFYKAYGQSLATRLTAIGHSEAQPRFVFVEDIDSPVEILSFTSNKTSPISAGEPILVWDNFDEDLSTGGRDNFHFALTGSCSILTKTLNQYAKTQAYRDCRAVLLKAIALMIQDAESGELGQEGIQLEVREFPLQKVGPVSTNWYGYGVQFSWKVPAELTLDEGDLQ